MIGSKAFLASCSKVQRKCGRYYKQVCAMSRSWSAGRHPRPLSSVSQFESDWGPSRTHR